MEASSYTAAMSLQQLTAKSFGSSSRMRGKYYFERGSVNVVSSDADARAEFRVRGALLYRTSLTFTPNQREVFMKCTCPHFKAEVLCKHLWASVLKSDEAKLFPSLGSEQDLVVNLDHAEDASASTRMAKRLPRGREAKRNSEVDASGVLPHWRQSIERAESKIFADRTSEPPAERAEHNRVAHFALDLGKSIREGRINLRFLAQEYLKSGTLGALKTVDLTQDSIALFPDPVDRKILWELLGKTETSGYYSNFYNGSRGVANATVPLEHAEELLRAVSREGRFHLLRARDVHGGARTDKVAVEPYAFVDEMWRLTLKLEHKGKFFVLTARLLAGEISRPLTDLLGRVGRFALFSDRIARSDVEASLTWLEVFKKRGEVAIPEAELDAFLEFYYQGGFSAVLELPPEINFTEIATTRPAARLKLEPQVGQSLFAATLEFNYLGQYVPCTYAAPDLVDIRKRERLARNFAVEAEIFNDFRALHPIDLEIANPVPNVHGYFYETDFLPTVEKALSLGWEVVAHQSKVRVAHDLKMIVNSGVDWFDLNAEFSFDGFNETLPHLIRALKAGQRMVQLGDGSFGILPEEWLKKFAPLIEMGQTTGTGIRLNKVQALFLSASLEENEKFSSDRKFQSLKTILDDLKNAKSVEPGSGFRGELRAYQKHGLSWLDALAKHEIGGILADDMGLGKTIQILAMLSRVKEQGEPGRQPHLIVAPKSLIFNWIKESEKFTPDLKILNFTGLNRHRDIDNFSQFDIVLTTYHSLRIDIERLQKKDFDFFILDEAHFIKNPDAQASLACRMIRASRKISLSGTPVENSLVDLFSILAVVNPGLVSDQQALKWSKISDPQELAILSRALRPFILRRTKEQVLEDLPPKSEQILYCELSPLEKKKYTELKTYYWNQLTGKFKDKGLARSKIEVLEALLRLRQAACHQGLLDPEAPDQPSAKFELLLDQVETIIEDGHKALIFSQFTTLLKLLVRRLDQKGIAFEYLDGKTTDRAERVERFQTRPDIKLFLLSLKAGGVGLNLTAADYVFVLDPWWNPAAESQAIDRAHRIGQSRKVFAYKLIAKDTVEEKILELQKSKRELANAIVSQDSGLLKNLNLEDLQALFT